MAGQVGIAAGGAEVAGLLAQGLGAGVFLRLAAGVEAFHYGDIGEGFALFHIFHQADAEAPGVGRYDEGAVVAGGLDELASVHFDIAKVNVAGEGGGDVVHQHMAEAGVQLGALEDGYAVVAGEGGVVGVKVKLAVFGEDDAVHGVAAFAEHLDEFEVLRHGGAGVVGRYGVAVQVEVGGQGGPPGGGVANGRRGGIIWRDGGGCNIAAAVTGVIPGWHPGIGAPAPGPAP